MSAWLHVVGIGEDGIAGLSDKARQLIASADVLVGGKRHHDLIGQADCERLSWPSPFNTLTDTLKRRRGQLVCVLASGDPLWFGVATTLARSFSFEDMAVHPSPSSVSLACARLGWAIESVDVVSVHGREPSRLNRAIYPGARLIVISHGADTPRDVANVLRDRGFGQSQLHVLEHLSGEGERHVQLCAQALAETDESSVFKPLHILGVEVSREVDGRWFPNTPGLPDEAYQHDGQLTKSIVRAATVTALAPAPGHVLWDIGAGSGSIGIEWLRAAPRARAYAIEPDADRVARININMHEMGVPELQVVNASAPEALSALPTPDAIFIGGGLTAALAERCWEALSPGGRLVVNAVTLESQTLLIELHERLGGQLTAIAASPVRQVGGYRAFEPLRTVTQWTGLKP